jgi:hypothetical protein
MSPAASLGATFRRHGRPEAQEPHGRHLLKRLHCLLRRASPVPGPLRLEQRRPDSVGRGLRGPRGREPRRDRRRHREVSRRPRRCDAEAGKPGWLDPASQAEDPALGLPPAIAEPSVRCGGHALRPDCLLRLRPCSISPWQFRGSLFRRLARAQHHRRDVRRAEGDVAAEDRLVAGEAERVGPRTEVGRGYGRQRQRLLGLIRGVVF